MLPVFYPRKSRSYRQAITYVLREQVKHGFIIKHNLAGQNPDAWVASFQHNENNRRKKSQRKDAVRLRHIVLPWQSRDPVTNEAMKDMTRNFMMTYSPHAMYLAVAHEPDDKCNNPHVHIIVGGTDIFGRALHLQDTPFRELKQKTENYQREHYPEYIHSQVEHGQGKNRSRDYWPKKRGRSYKEKLKRELTDILERSQSFGDFVEQVEQAGHIIWRDRRNGKVVGLTYQGRNHRFRTLGIGKERLRELDRDREIDLPH